jgi:AraC-like DNA-binding protein
MSSTSQAIIQRWSTAEVPESQRLDYYAAALADAVDPMCITRREVGPFHAEVAALACGPLSAIRVVGSEHGCVRGAREVARSGEHHFRLILNAASSWELNHRERSLLRPSDAVLLDSRIGHTTELHGSFDVIHLKLPEAWARQWIPDPAAIVGRAIRSESGFGRVLTSYIGQLSPDFIARSPLPLTVLADHLGALLALAAGELGGVDAWPKRRDVAMFERINECIVQRCAESSLTASDLATSLNISTRTLHRTLAACGQAFATMLIAARVDLAIRMLESPLFNRVTTAEIGKRAGFPDASHFVRVVRKRTGRTPLQVRRSGRNWRAD